MNISIELGEMYRTNVINFYEYNLELLNIKIMLNLNIF